VTVAARFWPKVNKKGPVPAHCHELGPCWVWTAGTNRQGYGQIMCAGPRGWCPQKAHRISWLLHHGTMPELCVLHACDNPRCVRPDHLFLGTVEDNNRDMRNKGRTATRLNAEQVRELRRERAAGARLKSIAAKYGITEGAVSAIYHRRNWGHIA